MHRPRPKNLNLFSIRFPLPAIASILHRISGFILFLLIPVLVWFLSYSLTDTGFDMLARCMSSVWAKLLAWAVLMPFCYHMVAGIRHLLSDAHVGNTRTGGKRAAMVVFVVSAVFIILVGVWIW